MVVPSVFVTGVTGYMGGDALAVIYKAHPDWQYSFLVRNEARAAPVKAQFPSGRLVVGSLEDADVLEREAKNADIVLNFASSDYAPAAKALAAGLAARDPSKPAGHLIHISGTAILTHPDSTGKTWGEPTDKVWDDVADIEAIQSFPDHAMHRSVDKIVIAAGAPHVPHVRRAIVCPPCVVGEGRGPVNRRTLQMPVLIELFRQRGRGFQVGRGQSAWSFVHVHDLSNAYLLLVEDAASGRPPRADWGEGAYYFVAAADRRWGDVARTIAARLHEKLPAVVTTAELDSISIDEGEKLSPLVPSSFASNSLSRSSRIERSLGWKPSVTDFEAEFVATVDHELEGAAQSRIADMNDGHAPHFG